jgi:hydrogenase maturation protein HypF
VIQRIRYLFTGIVQGVGFRPFIYRLARRHVLVGWVRNDSAGVYAEVEGIPSHIADFICDVTKTSPPMAEVHVAQTWELPPRGEPGFAILGSERSPARKAAITPDIATCDNCLAEMKNVADRRHHYPFINCTNCGPRLTIIRDIPYDRQRTSMACFPLCPDCQQEFDDPANRRFHAQPNACPTCGPVLRLLDRQGQEITSGGAPWQEAVRLLQEGAIVAIKGLGGFHLAVAADNDHAVQTLRLRKHRPEKPLAVMLPDIEAARRYAHINTEEERLLVSPQRPIVLLRQRPGNDLAHSIAPGMDTVGIMLPYTPLHHLLFADGFLTALVLTSANRSDEPICLANREAIQRLHSIADYFLVHNRDILVRCDDSIAAVYAGEAMLLRRSRGLTPKPLPLATSFPPVLALGAQMKGQICLLRHDEAVISPHIGDLETPLARDFLRENIDLLENITECHPDIIACDLHPDYYSSQAASRMTANTIIPVQHHHAHIVSCMAENQVTDPVLGLAMDGTGLGTDGRIWGGEFLLTDMLSFQRLGHFRYFLLPGGDQAIRQPWRTAAALLFSAFGAAWQDPARRLSLLPMDFPAPALHQMIERRVNCPETSSLGRLFDGVAAILGLRGRVSFEGQAAMELEASAGKGKGVNLPYEITKEGTVFILDCRPMIRALVDHVFLGASLADQAASFHQTIIAAITDMAGKIASETNIRRLALSGGCFQNRILLEGCLASLSKAGFTALRHRRVPTNDGGIALGQAVIAGSRMKKEGSDEI